jgi:hypothetical protein
MCAMWHKDPRPMLQTAAFEDGPQRDAHRMISVLCDDGAWHTARLEGWHFGPDGQDCLLSWHGAPSREYTGWYRYRKGSVRKLPDQLDDDEVQAARW